MAEIRLQWLRMQMFDPPFSEPIKVAGQPAIIPDSETKYGSFLEWWFAVGRTRPHEAQGWRTISGPGVMSGRMEAIPKAEWDALPDSERALIETWTKSWEFGIFYD